MELFDTVKNWIQRDREKFIYRRIPPAFTDGQDGNVAIQAGRHYFRLRLSEMFLTKKTGAGKSWYPAVQSMVRCDFGNQQQLEIPNVADAKRMKMDEKDMNNFIVRNFPLTPAIPFNGGMVSVTAALMAMEAQNYLTNFIGVLSGFAGLLAVPQLSAAVKVAKPLADGIQTLFGGGNGRVHLGLFETFAGGEMKAGYIVAIRATEMELDAEKLWVVGDQLRIGNGPAPNQNTAFTEFDYLLFRVELFEERDDWAKLTYLDEPFKKALNAIEDDNEKAADFYFRSAKRAVLEAPDLTEADQRRVIDKMTEKYNSAKQQIGQHGLTRDDTTLESLMKTAISVDAALEKGPPTLEEIFD